MQDHKRPQCPVFYPTMADMAGSFEDYIVRHEKRFAGVGICKIVAPSNWTPRKAGYTPVPDIQIARPIRQHATGSKGTFRMLMLEAKPMHLEEFATQAMSKDNSCNSNTNEPTDIERRYWQSMHLRPPLYGADIAGSLFDEGKKGWNLRRLDTVLSTVLKEAGHSLPGVNSPYLYFGTWRTTFAWHTEDMDLYSVNYLHYGATKHWYCIPPEHRTRFENLCKGIVPDLFRTCPEFFRHKELLISPSVLDTNHIPYVKVVQNPREFVITFPGAYHAGFNSGYNCAESVNFGTRRWIPIGALADSCTCAGDTVHINMKLFRHLVPKRLLPEDIFDDTSSDESSDEDSDDESSSEAEEGPVAEAADSSSEEEETSDGGGADGKKRKRKVEAAAPKSKQSKQKAPSAKVATPVKARAKSVSIVTSDKKAGKATTNSSSPSARAKTAKPAAAAAAAAKLAASAAKVKAVLKGQAKSPAAAKVVIKVAAVVVGVVTPRKRPTADSRATPPSGDSTSKRQKTEAGSATVQGKADTANPTKSQTAAQALPVPKSRVAKPLPPRVLGVRSMPSRVPGVISVSSIATAVLMSADAATTSTRSSVALPTVQAPLLIGTSPLVSAKAAANLKLTASPAVAATGQSPPHLTAQQQPQPSPRRTSSEATASRKATHPPVSPPSQQATTSRTHHHTHTCDANVPHSSSGPVDHPPIDATARVQPSKESLSTPSPKNITASPERLVGSRHRRPSAIAVLAAEDALATSSPTRRRQSLPQATSPPAVLTSASHPTHSPQQQTDRPSRASARPSPHKPESTNPILGAVSDTTLPVKVTSGRLKIKARSAPAARTNPATAVLSTLVSPPTSLSPDLPQQACLAPPLEPSQQAAGPSSTASPAGTGACPPLPRNTSSSLQQVCGSLAASAVRRLRVVLKLRGSTPPPHAAVAFAETAIPTAAVSKPAAPPSVHTAAGLSSSSDATTTVEESFAQGPCAPDTSMTQTLDGNVVSIAAGRASSSTLQHDLLLPGTLDKQGPGTSGCNGEGVAAPSMHEAGAGVPRPVAGCSSSRSVIDMPRPLVPWA